MSEVDESELRDFIDFNAKFITFLGRFLTISEESEGAMDREEELLRLIKIFEKLVKPGLVISIMYTDKLASCLGLDLNSIHEESYFDELESRYSDSGSKRKATNAIYEEVLDRNLPYFVENAIDQFNDFLQEGEQDGSI